MTIPATSSTTGASPTGSTQADQTAFDFNLLLKLLTTQIQNQDPLKPMDSTGYTQQLAQFSQVQQTVKQTSTLTDNLAQLTTQNVAQASSFIGKTAQFDYAVSGLSADRPARWSYVAASPVDGLKATITDSKGRTVATSTLTPGQKGDFNWDGTLANGGKAPDGTYTLSLTGTTATGATVPVAISTSGRVDEVIGGGGAVTLGVNGAQIPVSKLIKLAS